MTLAEFDALCGTLPGTSMAVQWGESHVHKVGGKMFALGNADADAPGFVFKATPLSYEMLLQQGLASRAPYLPRGHWVLAGPAALPDAELADYIRQSHGIVAGGLTRATRRGLGLG